MGLFERQGLFIIKSVSTAPSTMPGTEQIRRHWTHGSNISSRALGAILSVLLGICKSALQVKKLRKKAGIVHFAMNTSPLGCHFFCVALNLTSHISNILYV